MKEAKNMTLQGFMLIGTCLLFTTCAVLIWFWARSQGMWQDIEAAKYRMIDEHVEREGAPHES